MSSAREHGYSARIVLELLAHQRTMYITQSVHIYSMPNQIYKHAERHCAGKDVTTKNSVTLKK